MQPMTTYEFGTIILVPFPFKDQAATKQRPAVVVSTTQYHRERPDLIILAITSQFRATMTVGEAAIANWRAAGLLKPSVFKPLVATVERHIVLKELGRLAAEDRATLCDVLSEMVGA
jgi:mRNA interferase MazF